VPEESYPAFHEIVKHASHTRIPGAGHLIPQELPNQLAAELVGYLKNLDKSAFLGVKAKL
jgi:pimeloyl-ACP methyl ester carboxylesterase